MLPGDKIVWMIALLLSMVSLVTIFSSTSTLAAQEHVSRIALASKQMFTIATGLLLIFVCCLVGQSHTFRLLSKWGFLLSFLLLVPLVLKLDLGFIKAQKINDAFRTLNIFGVSFSVYEVVKVAMVMYIAWAIDHLKHDTLKWEAMAKASKNLTWLTKPFWKDVIYLFLPTLTVCVMILAGGTSSAIMTGIFLFLTMILGGVRVKPIILMGLLAIGLLAGCYGLYKASDGKMFTRFGTVESRASMSADIDEVENPRSKDTYTRALDRIRQPYGAEIAVKSGGIWGKGPGQSTQKYKVSVIYEDYMYSFIIEEYGLITGIIVLMLYVSLMARGILIVKNCKGNYEKIAVAGLCTMIVIQAMFHIIINCHIGIHTGQTLPLISHGMTSYLAFCIAFGVIISISRLAEKNLEEEARRETLLNSADDGEKE